MRIRELRLLRYGKFTDRLLALPNAPQDIHLVVGANEAGKSTMRRALSDWLFGFPMRSTGMDFLHPMQDLRQHERARPIQHADPVPELRAPQGPEEHAAHTG